MGAINNFTKKIMKKTSFYKQYNRRLEELEKKQKALEKVANNYNQLFNTLYLDYDLTPKPILKGFQDLSVEFLIFINNICKKYDLQWAISSGLILGAMRHDGFVPWDDDLDSIILRTDYNTLIDVIEDELELYGLQDNIGIQYQRKRKVEGKLIDTFLQMYYVDSEQDQPRLTSLDFFPYDYKTDYTGGDIGPSYEKARVKYFKDIADGLDRETRLKNYYEDFHLSYEKQDYMMEGAEGVLEMKRRIKPCIYQTDKILPFKPIKFNGVMLPGPNNPDYYLTTLYGNWRKIPKGIHFHGRMARLRKNPNTVELYERNIKKLKEVNAKFE
ncbi:MAG: LicD family protein [Methanobrevibacter sp.]|nr:LicD family protein [Methanobrevibacter sp.]